MASIKPSNRFSSHVDEMGSPDFHRLLSSSYRNFPDVSWKITTRSLPHDLLLFLFRKWAACCPPCYALRSSFIFVFNFLNINPTFTHTLSSSLPFSCGAFIDAMKPPFRFFLPTIRSAKSMTWRD